MKFSNVLIVVKDMQKSKDWYFKVLGAGVANDFGANVSLDCGICFQTLDSWVSFIKKPTEQVLFGANNAELYFEEDDFDSFTQKLESLDVNYVHKIVEHGWGQRAVRFYDPDGHIIEVGENMVSVVKKFIAEGMSIKQAAARMDVPESYVAECLKQQ